MKVLIVDKDESTRANLDPALEVMGFYRFYAKNSEEALASIEEIFPDIIVAEIDLPDKSGIALYQHMKTKELMEHLPVVFYSANTDKPTITRAFKMGCAGYMVKSADTTQIVEKIQDVRKQLEAKAQSAVYDASGNVAISRSERRTILTFPTSISAHSISHFRDLNSDHFKANTARDYYIFDLRSLPLMELQQMVVLELLLSEMDKHRTVIVAGRNIRHLMDFDGLPPQQVFMEMAEAEEFLEGKTRL